MKSLIATIIKSKLFKGVFLTVIVSALLYCGLAVVSRTPSLDTVAAATSFAPSIDGVSINGPELTLPPSTKIVVASDEPESVKRAVVDLQRDMEKVLGQRPSVVSSPSEIGSESAIIISFRSDITVQYRDTSLMGEESHQYSVRTVDNKNYLVIQGADERGTLYAIYTFSDKVVGIPPLWYWADWQPETKSSLIVPQNGGVRVVTPQVRYRTWFLNNQDLFGSWNSGDDKYDVVFETMLRLKLNTWYIGEQVGEYGGGWLPKAQAAQNRGLQLAANNLAQFRKWDTYWTDIKKTSPPALTLANKATFDEFWRYSVQFAKDNNLNVLWILGFRGRGDESFWEAMSDAPTTDTARGDVEEQMLAKQMQIVREVTGEQHPKMAFVIWNELTTLTEKGALQLPQDQDLIWTFGNDIRDHFPRSDARTYSLPSTQPFGYYMNLQFYSTGAHLAEAEGPWKAYKNFSMVAGRKSGQRMDMAILNVGNVREFLLTSAATSEMMWNISTYNPDTVLQKLFSRYFSPTLASQLVTTYKSYINAYWQQKGSDISGFEKQYIFQDLRTVEAMSIQLNNIKKKVRNLNPFDNERMRIDNAYNVASSQVGSVMKGSQVSYQAFENVVNSILGYKAQIPPSKQSFYTDTFVLPAQFMSSSYKTLYLITRSHFKVSSTSLTETVCYLREAQVEANNLSTALNEGKHGRFVTWYDGEELYGVSALQTQISTTLSSLPSATCSTPTSSPTPTPTKVVTPTPTPTTSIPTPTPTKVVNPTPTPTPTVVTPSTYSVTSYANTLGLKTSTVKDSKRTVIRAMRSLTLKQIACYGCGIGSTITLRNSSSTFSLGSQILSIKVQGVTSSWAYVNINTSLVGGRYYIVEFTPAVTPVYYGTTSQSYTDFQFVRYATSGAPSWKYGAWQIQLTYQK